MTYIYALVDPRTQQCRYVGKADDPVRRLQRHLQKKRLQDRTHKATWLRSVVAAGFWPELFILEAVPKHGWAQAEKFWIAYLRMVGAELTNGTHGGDGGSFKGEKNPMHGRKGALHPCYGKPRTKEVIERIRAAQKGKKRNIKPEVAEKLRAMAKARTGEKNPFFGKKHSEETRLAWSKKRLGTKLTQYQKDRLSVGREKTLKNRRLKFTVGSETKTLNEWSDLCGIRAGTIKSRIHRDGWSVEEALLIPVRATAEEKRIYTALKEKGRLQDIVLDLVKKGVR